ncbi:MAG: putative thiosulfate sulfurtransferase [Methanosaeta sp. PtaU1.Bin112]|nr:MAG: putative thiosulfate sulfurtransferase [Methanosaeta sp. PtaU1.Bin112]
MTSRYSRYIVSGFIKRTMLISGNVSALLQGLGLMLGLALCMPALAEAQADNLAGLPSGVFVSPSDLSPDDIVLDISPDGTRFIEGAVNINYEGFMENDGQLKSTREIAAMLSEAGLSSNDSLAVAGECLPCGGGPSPAFFSYWLLKYLGHENVRILQGHPDDWKAAGLNISNMPATREKTEYIAHTAAKLLATYEFVVAGGAQIVDARLARDYAIGSIPGAVNIPYEMVLSNESLRQKADLEKVFAELDKDRPVVVYTNLGVEASIVWLALQLSGYDARLYSWRDWLENQPKFNYELTKADANPNPVKSGRTTTITVSFRELEADTKSSSSDNSSNDKVKLTVKGCATCGFGSPQGFANLARKDGFVQIGSTGQAASATGGNDTEVQKADRTLRCSAIINAADGTEVTRMSMLQTSAGKYMGIWSANVDPGTYNVSIAATVSGNVQTFVNVLQITVTG